MNLSSIKFINFGSFEKKRLPGLCMSVYKKKGIGVTFSSEVSHSVLEAKLTHVRVAINTVTDEVYLVFGKEGIPCQAVGKEDTKNLSIRTESVAMEIASILGINIKQETWYSIFKLSPVSNNGVTFKVNNNQI